MVGKGARQIGHVTLFLRLEIHAVRHDLQKVCWQSPITGSLNTSRQLVQKSYLKICPGRKKTLLTSSAECECDY